MKNALSSHLGTLIGHLLIIVCVFFFSQIVVLFLETTGLIEDKFGFFCLLRGNCKFHQFAVVFRFGLFAVDIDRCRCGSGAELGFHEWLPIDVDRYFAVVLFHDVIQFGK